MTCILYIAMSKNLHTVICMIIHDIIDIVDENENRIACTRVPYDASPVILCATATLAVVCLLVLPSSWYAGDLRIKTNPQAFSGKKTRDREDN